MTTILSSGQKKQKASRVFGELGFLETESSLCYSPSPRSKMSRQITTDGSDSNSSPTVLFETETNNNKVEQSLIDAEDKENVAENTSLTNGERDNGASLPSIKTRLRAYANSPQRRDLLKKTQAAIKQATTSVEKSLTSSGPTTKNNSSTNKLPLNPTRKGNEPKLRERAVKTKSVRFQWDEEKSETKSFHEKVEEQRRQILAVQRQLASAHFKEKTRKDEARKWNQIAEAEKNSQFNSEVYRDHQKKLKEERDRKRKESIDARARIRLNKREGEEKMRMMKIKEDQAIFDVRYDLHRAKKEAAKSYADERRKSFQFRAGDAKRIKEARAQWKEDKFQKEHADFELRTAAAKDVEIYNKKMASDRRKSLKNRNLEARKRREEEKRQKHATMMAEHESYELKFASERDADDYRKKVAAERRKSLANRNKESARHAEVMKELRNIAQEKEAESFMLKWAGENDAKAYIAKLAEDRRKSLKFRGEIARKHRLYDEEQHAVAVANAFDEGVLQSQCQKDVDNYRKECEERRRKSLQFRGKECKVQRLEEESRNQKQQELDEQAFALDSLARMDVEEYIKDCKKERRKSLAFRAKEKRRHAEWKRQQKEKELKEQAHTSHLKSLDAQHIKLAKQQERARMAIDALRNAGCTIKGNPFSDILGL